VLLFITIVVITPITNWAAYIGYFLLLLILISISQIPYLIVFKRALIEIPFIFFAILMPFFGTGERFEFLFFNFYREGLLAGAGIVAKGTIGVISAIILSSSTSAREILRGLERLHLPSLMVQIASFMLRYVNVVNDEMERMKVARASRGFEATGVKHWRVLATAAGALFIRSYERGERVHLAMLSRGYSGTLPQDELVKLEKQVWLTVSTLPVTALLINLITTVIGR
jgi:cobalt/nickel transport system permease protein